MLTSLAPRAVGTAAIGGALVVVRSAIFAMAVAEEISKAEIPYAHSSAPHGCNTLSGSAKSISPSQSSSTPLKQKPSYGWQADWQSGSAPSMRPSQSSSIPMLQEMR